LLGQTIMPIRDALTISSGYRLNLIVNWAST
jgi:hypothetical protein